MLWRRGRCVPYSGGMTNAMMPQPTPGPQSGPESQPAPAAQPQVPVHPAEAPLKVARRRFSTVGMALVIALLFFMGLSVLASGVLLAVFPDGNIPGWLMWAVNDLTVYGIALPLGFLALSRVPALPTRRFALGAGEWFALFAMCMPIMYAGNLIGIVLSALFSGGSSSNRLVDSLAVSDPWSVLVFMVIIGPIAEEWFFRKQIIDRTRIYGEKTAMLLSALVFALFHGNLYQFFYAFGLGLMFAYMYLRTSRLRYSVALHMVINAMGSLVPTLLMRLLGGSTGDVEAQLQKLSGMGEAEAMRAIGPGLAALSAYGMLLLTLIIVGIVLLIVRRKRFEFYTAPWELPKGLVGRAVYSTPGIVTYLVLAGAITIAAVFLG